MAHGCLSRARLLAGPTERTATTPGEILREEFIKSLSLFGLPTPSCDLEGLIDLQSEAIAIHRH